MYRPGPAAILVALLSLIVTCFAAAGAPESLAKARALLEQKNARGAVEVLELSLPADQSHRAELLELLRRAYADAARQAESEGNSDEAELFRDNFEILNRKPKGSQESSTSDSPKEDQAPPAKEVQVSNNPEVKPNEPLNPEASSPKPLAEPGPAEIELPKAKEEAKPAPAVEEPAPTPQPEQAGTVDKTVRPISLPSDPTPAPAAAAEEPSPSAREPMVTVASADLAFLAKRYDEAGRRYAALDAQHRLPSDRRDHWAYCRSVDVVRRINAKPKTAKEWESIDAEIRQIRILSPKNWFGEYLSSRAAERSGGRQSSRSNKLVVRGSAPDDGPAPNSPVPFPQAPANRPATAGESAKAADTQALAGNWQVVQTANFRVFHLDPALANRVAQVAEATRSLQVKRWSGVSTKATWSPRCDIYLFPSASVFGRMTGQPEDSPGFSTMGMNNGRVVTRRVNLRADHANLVAAILPHEVTHVVLADLFPNQQIPRWADEGMAVLSEPVSEQGLRAADLEKPLASGRVFQVNELMSMDYPDGKLWSLYYAQSVSLTRFLVEQSSPTQFVRFVQGSQRNGPEAELRRLYQIDGFDDLQKRWLEYARAKSSELTAEAGTESKGNSVRR